MTRPPFRNRVRVVGTLTLTTDLYLGDGGAADRPQTAGPDTVGVATVARDADGNPVIPGAALRGVVRHYLKAGGADAGAFDWLFGKEPTAGTVGSRDPTQADLGCGGRVEFTYAVLDPKSVPDRDPPVAGYDRGRKTGTAMSVGIDRVTRTARDRLLYAADYVPRDTRFRCEVVGYDLDDDHLAVLLRGLHGFNDAARPVRLGANHADHCGRAAWTTARVERLDAAGARAWLERVPMRPWADGATKHAAAEALDETALLGRPAAALRPASVLSLAVTLKFSSPLLVNDPTRCKPANAKKDDDRPNHTPRRSPDGRVFLPASSFRGAFRSQAERIVRTLNTKTDIDPHRAGPPPVDDLIADLFGHTGRRSRVEVTDFLPVDGSAAASRVLTRQEFVAVDRFTGGAAEKLKFNAERANADLTLSGTITLADSSSWAVGLLILTLRDLIEGDVTFGFGAAKGYGRCTAAVAGWPTGIAWPCEPKAAVAEFRKRVKGVSGG